MVRYDISAEAGQELLKGFAKVPGAKITSIPSKTLLHTSKAKTICGRRDTSVKMMKKKSEFYVYQFDGKEHSEVVLVSYLDGDIVKRKPLEVFKYNKVPTGRDIAQQLAKLPIPPKDVLALVADTTSVNSTVTRAKVRELCRKYEVAIIKPCE